MKTILTIFILILFNGLVYSQKTVDELLNNEIIELLKKDGTLLTDKQKQCTGKCRPNSPWKNNRQKNKALEKDKKLENLLLTKFLAPTFCVGRVIPSNLEFKNKSIGKLGSYIIRDNDFTVINTSTPILPVLSTGNQISIPNPQDDGSNYILNYTSTNLFEGHVNMEADGKFLTYFSAKMSSSLSLSNKKRTQISIGAGIFKNQLGVLYKKALNNEISAIEFNSLYRLWLSHKNGEIQNNDKIIFSFDGLCYFSSTGIEKSSQSSFSSEINSSGTYPFLSYGLNTSSKWEPASSLSGQTNIYNIYMFSVPDLIAIPSVDDILSNWNNLSNISSAITFPSSKTIPTNSPLIVKVTFGPIANNNMLNLIKLDENYSLNNLEGSPFINKIKLITDNHNRITSNINRYYTFEIEIYRDEKYITTNSESLNNIIKAEFPIRIYIDKPIQGKYLEKKYDKIKVETERYPTPYFSEYQVSSNKETNTNNYVYKAKIKFNAPSNIKIATTPKPPKIAEVFGLPTNVDEQLKNNLKNSTFRALANNEFEFTFHIPISSNYFNINQRSYDIELLLKFTAKNSNYNRKLPLRILAPVEQLVSIENKITTNILIEDNGELIGSLNKNAILESGITINVLVNKFTENGDLDILSFIEELKKESDLTLTQNNKYLINPEFIDVNKLNK